ncbi:MAG: hypothetical protein ACRDRJ_00050 [Streptosporangiaceae bacterium]
MAGTRRSIPAATEAALWALSNGRCYAPGCTAPVVVEVRPGVYRKNAQIAHIRGVRAPRHDPALTEAACASFTNLLILCLPHHGEVDDKTTGERLYPVAKLTRWKTDHEGANGPALAALGQVDEETLARLLTQVFSPPARRLEQIADQLETTGTLTASTLVQLRQVVQVMNVGPARTSADTAEMLAYAAGVFSRSRFRDAVLKLGQAADTMSSKTMADQIGELHGIADALTAAAARIQRNRGQW